jgi:hypothetical protein
MAPSNCDKKDASSSWKTGGWSHVAADEGATLTADGKHAKGGTASCSCPSTRHGANERRDAAKSASIPKPSAATEVGTKSAAITKGRIAEADIFVEDAREKKGGKGRLGNKMNDDFFPKRAGVLFPRRTSTDKVQGGIGSGREWFREGGVLFPHCGWFRGTIRSCDITFRALRCRMFIKIKYTCSSSHGKWPLFDLCSVMEATLKARLWNLLLPGLPWMP